VLAKNNVPMPLLIVNDHKFTNSIGQCPIKNEGSLVYILMHGKESEGEYNCCHETSFTYLSADESGHSVQD